MWISQTCFQNQNKFDLQRKINILSAADLFRLTPKRIKIKNKQKILSQGNFSFFSEVYFKGWGSFHGDHKLFKLYNEFYRVTHNSQRTRLQRQLTDFFLFFFFLSFMVSGSWTINLKITGKAKISTILSSYLQSFRSSIKTEFWWATLYIDLLKPKY